METIPQCFENGSKAIHNIQIVKNVVDDGGKVIVWASYIPVMYGLYNLLSDYLPLMVHGAVKSASNLQEEENPETREWRFNEFKNSTHRNVLIANPGACGESISLHHWCNTAIYVTRNYNGSHDNNGSRDHSKMRMTPSIKTANRKIW